jgi:hypothetical protein
MDATACYALHLKHDKNTSMIQQQQSDQNRDDLVTTSPVLRALRPAPLHLLALPAQIVLATVEERA